MEMCSVTRVTKEAKKLHLKAGPDMDLRNGWNVDLAAKREESFEYIRKVRPLTIIGSPMCTMFSQLQSLSGRTRSKQGKHSKAACHMEFMAKVHMGTRGRRMVFRTRTFTSSNILEVEAHGGSWESRRSTGNSCGLMYVRNDHKDGRRTTNGGAEKDQVPNKC